jgi:hypothetical protein
VNAYFPAERASEHPSFSAHDAVAALTTNPNAKTHANTALTLLHFMEVLPV